MTRLNSPEEKPGPVACNIKAAVFFNGECDLPVDFFLQHPLYDDFDFFCADGGANIALKFGIIPQTVVGDMDSISISSRRKLEPLSRFIEFPVDKEKSDGELLLELLIREGYSIIHVFAATGGRMDQTLFNTQLLQRFPQARIITAQEEIYYLPSGSIIEDKNHWQASLIPVTAAVKGLTTSGFRYNLKRHDITYGSTLTLSNVIIADTARVSYGEGALLVVLGRPANLPGKKRSSGLKLIKGKKDR